MVLACNTMMTDEIYLVLFEVLFGMLVLFMVDTSTSFGVDSMFGIRGWKFEVRD